MGILAAIGKALASLFDTEVELPRMRDIPPMPPCKKYPGDISEPVLMMLKSIERDPRRWKVKIKLPEFDLAAGYVGGRTQRRGHTREVVHIGLMVTDTNVGETFEGGVWIDKHDVLRCYVYQTSERISRYAVLHPEGVSDKPDWMTMDEAAALGQALFEAYQVRFERVFAWQNRESTRREELANARRVAAKEAERKRLIQVYKGV